MKHICTIAKNVPVSLLATQLKASPALWNQHSKRTTDLDSPHRGVSDIWVRYADAKTNAQGPHESVWYSGSDYIPAVRDIVSYVMGLVKGERLGGVLITRIPPGGEVLPHVDAGWHAGYYQKYAVQIASHNDQAFCFADGQHKTKPGDVYWFDNAYEHWVINNSPVERITLIICIKPESPAVEENKLCLGLL
jgi:hypothetical protein